MNCRIPQRRELCIPTVKHHIVCRHQIEVEIWPAAAEVYFQDERYENPIDAQMRFSASVYNAPTGKVTWQVLSLTGGPGAGAVDASGLYTAPLKGSHPFTLTDIIVATSVDDPMRMAYARVAVVGRGPEPLPVPRVEIFPKTAYLYYPNGNHNDHIDKSNTMQIFQSRLRNASSTQLNWSIQDNADSPAPPLPVPVSGWHQGWYLYKLSGSGSQKTVKISASLASDPSVQDEAIVIHLNYSWPGIVAI